MSNNFTAMQRDTQTGADQLFIDPEKYPRGAKRELFPPRLGNVPKRAVALSFDSECSTVAPSPALTAAAHRSPSLSPMMGPVNHDFGDITEFELAGMHEPARIFDTTLSTSLCALTNTRINRSGVSPIPESFDSSPGSSPPVTPRVQPSIDVSFRMPSTPRRKPGPALLRALRLNSLPKVREALDKDPEAAALVFWDNKMEPPLCCAVRLGCDVAIVELLLKCGADVNASDVNCQTPLDILRSAMRSRVRQAAGNAPFFDFLHISHFEQMRKDIERLLLAAGAKEERSSSVEGNAAPFVFTWDAAPKNFDVQSVADEMSSLLLSIPVHNRR